MLSRIYSIIVRIACLFLALAAKYWLSNKLPRNNVITDGFYDFGAVSGSGVSIKPFPSLEDLAQAPIDKKRETLLIDSRSDPDFAAWIRTISEGLSSRKPLEQAKFIAQTVTDALGGVVRDSSKTADIGFKVHITSLKLEAKSNVLPIGLVKHGTFYHRALLFKALCDRIGLGPVSLVRGEYNRAWNEIEVSKLCVLGPQSNGTTSKSRSAGKGNRASVAAKLTAGSTPDDIEFDPRQYGTLTDEDSGFKVGIIDLMYQPGRIMELGSVESREYMRSQ